MGRARTVSSLDLKHDSCDLGQVTAPQFPCISQGLRGQNGAMHAKRSAVTPAQQFLYSLLPDMAKLLCKNLPVR